MPGMPGMPPPAEGVGLTGAFAPEGRPELTEECVVADEPQAESATASTAVAAAAARGRRRLVERVERVEMDIVGFFQVGGARLGARR
ncbi:hypothetical protein GCM10010442_20420 [Kitasatospora kifunensis]